MQALPRASHLLPPASSLLHLTQQHLPMHRLAAACNATAHKPGQLGRVFLRKAQLLRPKLELLHCLHEIAHKLHRLLRGSHNFFKVITFGGWVAQDTRWRSRRIGRYVRHGAWRAEEPYCLWQISATVHGDCSARRFEVTFCKMFCGQSSLGATIRSVAVLVFAGREFAGRNNPKRCGLVFTVHTKKQKNKPESQ